MNRAFVLVAILVAAGPAHAHHAITAIYDSSKQITLDGVVVDFQFVNPHPFVTVEIADANGRPQQWRLEMDNRFELVAVGMTSETFRKGDRVSLSGGPARDGSRALYVRRLDRPADGFWYEQAGSSPRTGKRTR